MDRGSIQDANQKRTLDRTQLFLQAMAILGMFDDEQPTQVGEGERQENGGKSVTIVASN